MELEAGRVGVDEEAGASSVADDDGCTAVEGEGEVFDAMDMTFGVSALGCATAL